MFVKNISLFWLSKLMKVIEWDEAFDAAYGIINLNPNLYVFYRGYDPAYPLSERPAYFGTQVVAEQYTKKTGHTLSAFTNTRQLKLIDIRFMKNILRDIFQANSDEYALNDEMKSVTFSFGLCSLYHQIWMAVQRYKDSMSNHINQNKTLTMKDALKALQSSYKYSAYEQSGVRIAETINDALTMGFLKGLFEEHIDGFIAPQTYSPFHIERTNNILMSELVIFNPLKCGFRKFDKLPKIIVYENMYDVYMQNNLYVLSDNNFKKLKYQIHVQFECDDEIYLPSVEELHMQYETNDDIKHNYEKGLQSGRLLSKSSSFYIPESEKPCVPISAWSTQLRINKTRKNKQCDYDRYRRY